MKTFRQMFNKHLFGGFLYGKIYFLHKFNNSAIAGFTFALYDSVNKIKY